MQRYEWFFCSGRTILWAFDLGRLDWINILVRQRFLRIARLKMSRESAEKEIAKLENRANRMQNQLETVSFLFVIIECHSNQRFYLSGAEYFNWSDFSSWLCFRVVHKKEPGWTRKKVKIQMTHWLLEKSQIVLKLLLDSFLIVRTVLFIIFRTALGCSESFWIIRTVSRLSGQFVNCPDSFITIWTVPLQPG